MRKNISFFKKIKLFRVFKITIDDNSLELESRFNLRTDNAYRLYTVINIPEELVGEAYSLKKADIDLISESYIKQYSADVSKYLNSKGLNELFDFYKIDKVGKYSYLLVFGFSLFKSDRYYNNIYYKLIPTIAALIVLLFFILL
jgi:hypothetical protein